MSRDTSSSSSNSFLVPPPPGPCSFSSYVCVREREREREHARARALARESITTGGVGGLRLVARCQRIMIRASNLCHVQTPNKEKPSVAERRGACMHCTLACSHCDDVILRHVCFRSSDDVTC